jgi:hypothetical protein
MRPVLTVKPPMSALSALLMSTPLCELLTTMTTVSKRALMASMETTTDFVQNATVVVRPVMDPITPTVMDVGTMQHLKFNLPI